MAYTPPGITVNQVAPQPQPGGAAIGRTITALFTSYRGPDTAVRISASQVVSVFGDPTNPLSSGYGGPNLLRITTSQVAAAGGQALSIIGCRVGVTRASASMSDGSAGVPMVLKGIGNYAGSRGNYLQCVINAPQVSVSELQRGNSILPEIQQITFYELGGSPTGGITLGYGGTNASAPITASTITGGGAAAALQTYLQSISTIGSGNVTVTAVTTPAPITGAFTFNVTGAGTKATGPLTLITTATSTLAAGTGVIPVVSVVINDTISGSPVTLQTLAAGTYNLGSNAAIYGAINAQNPLNSVSSVVLATTLSISAGIPITQTLTFTGGADGLGATGTDATIAPLLAASLNLGNADFIVAAFDALVALPAIQNYITNALAVNIFPKAILGPQQGTQYATLSTTYQQANSDRVVIVGHDNVTGTNPINGTLNYPVDGFLVAGAIAGIKAATSPQYNLLGTTLSGFSSAPPIAPDIGVPLTTTQLNTLAAAGFTVLVPQPAIGRLGIRDLISTAPQIDQYGQPNRFIYLSERDAFDAIALQLIAGLSPLIGSPASTPAQTTNVFNSYVTQIMQASLGILHNGATATAIYDPIANVVTINVGYGDRPPLNYLVINLAPIAGYTPGTSS